MSLSHNPAITGGIWSDTNLKESLDWEGTDIPKEPTGPSTLDPTARDRDPPDVKSPGSSIVSKSDEARIRDKVLQSITAQLGGTGTSVQSAIRGLLAPMEDRIKTWVESRSEVSTQAASTDQKILELSGRVELLTSQVEDLMAVLTTRNERENAILEQAMDIVRDKTAAEMTTEEAEAKLAEMRRRRDDIKNQMADLSKTPSPAQTRTTTTKRRPGKIY